MKLPVVSGEEVIKALHRAGFRAVRQKGSHVRLEKRVKEGTIKVTVPLNSLAQEKNSAGDPEAGWTEC